mmetsp:Transcript_10180/g.30622  ORF Transcript_10180/g.30622 Transcript_10180/m.30622 type:complete len:238 (-) Transcript_10180:382-1095(-)
MAMQIMRRLACAAASQGRQYSAQAGGAAAAPRIIAGAMLERNPVITPDLPDWEAEHQQWLSEYKQEYRKTYPPDWLDPKGTLKTEGNLASVWKPAPRITEADKTGDVRTLDRKLDRRLLLLLKSPGGANGEGVWHVPLTPHEDTETVREAADRAMRDQLALPGTQAFTLGNVPAAHHPQPDGSGVLFYVKMQLIEGDVRTSAPKGYRWYDFAWVSADEVEDYFKHDPAQGKLLRELL